MGPKLKYGGPLTHIFQYGGYGGCLEVYCEKASNQDYAGAHDD